MDREDHTINPHTPQDAQGTSPAPVGDAIDPAFRAAFHELTPVCRLTIEDMASSLPMPDPDVTARAVDLMLATLFDVFRNTRMEPAAPHLATSIVLAFVTIADRTRRDWHSATDRLRALQDGYDGSEVATVELEDRISHARSLEEVHTVACAMRDRAIQAWEAETGRAFVTSKRASVLHAKNTASLIEASDYLRAIRQRHRDATAPEGPIVIVSGGTLWHDVDLITRRLDAIKARVPHMVLATTGQDQGVDAIALYWARRNGVHLVAFRPNFSRDGRRAGYRRNEQMLGLRHIVEAILCEGGQVQIDLYNRLKARGVPVHTFNLADQAPAPRAPALSRHA